MVLASSRWHIASTRLCAVAASLSARSISIYLPWRTSATPAKPSEPSACAIALPCGSSTPVLRVMWTRAFTSVDDPRHLDLGVGLGQHAEPARDLLIGLLDVAEIVAEPVLVHLLVGLGVPQPAI